MHKSRNVKTQAIYLFFLFYTKHKRTKIKQKTKTLHFKQKKQNIKQREKKNNKTANEQKSHIASYTQ